MTSISTMHLDDTGEWHHSAPVEVEQKDSPLWHHTAGLQYTSTGYGRRIPTRTMVRYLGKWRRVYCCIYSNSGTCYIGEFVPRNGSPALIVSD